VRARVSQEIGARCSNWRRGGALAARNRRALKTWQRLHKLDPVNEIVIVGLGESQFQAALKNDARATRGRVYAIACARRCGAICGWPRYCSNTISVDDAIAEAKRAQALEPKSVETPPSAGADLRAHEEDHEAVAEWNTCSRWRTGGGPE
jgi:hypothetical protein